MSASKRFIPDKRRAPREPHDSVLELFDETGVRLAAVATLGDVSATGASFKTAFVLAKGARLRARLRLLGRPALDLTGRIVRIKELSNRFVYGLAFDSVSPVPRPAKGI